MNHITNSANVFWVEFGKVAGNCHVDHVERDMDKRNSDEEEGLLLVWIDDGVAEIVDTRSENKCERQHNFN